MKLDWENLPRTIGIVGSREFPNPDLVKDAIYDLISFLEEDTTIISGGAAGVDSWAYEAARFFLNKPPEELKPDKAVVQQWLDKGLPNKAAYAKAAFARNEQIVRRVKKDEGILFAFKYTESKTKGTDNTCDWCNKLYVPCIIFRIGDENEWQVPITNDVLMMNQRWSKLIKN
jgi:anaerobic selenocysteine-containing dehydrogenase